MSIEKSAVSAERWREVACFLADQLEEMAMLADVVTDDTRRALNEFHDLCDEDDPEDAEALR